MFEDNFIGRMCFAFAERILKLYLKIRTTQDVFVLILVFIIKQCNDLGIFSLYVGALCEPINYDKKASRVTSVIYD